MRFPSATRLPAVAQTQAQQRCLQRSQRAAFSRNSLTQGCRRNVGKTLYPVTDLVVVLGRQVDDLDAKFFRQRICDQRPMTVRGVRLEAEETDASPLAYQRRQYFKLGLSLFGREV